MGKSSKQKKRQQKAGKKEHPVAQKPKASPPPPAHASAPKPAKKTALSALQEKLMKKLSGGRFRQLNEDLYTSSGSANFARFSADPELADAYHRGFREQARGWPENPLDAIIAALASGPRRVVADFGCGDARLAAELNATHEVHSFDLVATAPGVVACNVERVPLAAASVDVAVFCLALMGPSHWAFLREAHRVLRPDGELRVTEVKSRFDQGRKRVIQRRFNVSVPRARVSGKATPLRERSER